MKQSDLDRLNPKADPVTGFDFYNRGNLSKDSYSHSNSPYGILFFITFIATSGIFLLLLFNSSYYLKNYGDSLKALAISLLIIATTSFIISFIVNKLFLKIKYNSQRKNQ